MKYLRLLSDLHLECANFKLPPLDTDSESLLILAGDIHTGHDSIYFLNKICHQFHHIIYVFGNHEYYTYDINAVKTTLKDKLATQNISNVSVVDSAEMITIDGLKFVCGTLWTDMDKDNAISHSVVGRGLNDFLLIRNGNKMFTTQDAYKIHIDTMDKFAEWVDETTIVITHHMPSDSCVNPRYKNSGSINAGFRSALEEFILDKQPKYWFHGHGHDSVNVQVGQTKILSNPRGYPQGYSLSEEDQKFENEFFNDTFVIEL